MTKKQFILIFIVIFTWGLFLRSYNYMQRTGWHADSSRDLIIAKHIVEFNEHTNARPNVGSKIQIFQNSPLYYYFISLFWRIGGSIEGAVLATILWNSLIIPLAARITLLLTRSRFAALIAAFFFASNVFFVDIASTVFQPNYLPTLTLLYGMVAILAFQHKSVSLLNLSIILGFIGLHIHLSQLIFLPTLIIVSALIAHHIFKHKKNPIISPFITTTLLLISWISIAYRGQPHTEIVLNLGIDKLSVLVKHVLDALVPYLKLTYSNFSYLPTQFEYYFVLLIFIAVAAYLGKLAIENCIYRIMLASLSSMLLIVWIIYPDAPTYYYLMPSYPLIILLPVITLSQLFGKQQFLRLSFTIFISIFMLLTLWHQTIFTVDYRDLNQYELTQRMANAILIDSKASLTDGVIDYEIPQYPHPCDLGSTNFWIFLEQFEGHKLVNIIDFPHNLGIDVSSNAPHLNHLYIICCNQNPAIECINQNKLEKYYSYTYKRNINNSSSMQRIFTESNDRFNYSIYRYNIDN